MLSPLTRVRVIVGFMATPFVAGLITFLIFAGLRMAPQMDAAADIGYAAGLIAIPITLFAAAPVFLWLSGRGLTPFRTILSGVVCGIVPYVILMLLLLSAGARSQQRSLPVEIARMSGEGRGLDWLRTSFLIGAISAATAAVFWMVAIYRSELDRRRTNLD